MELPPTLNIIEVIQDPDWIGDVISPQQETVLRAIYGLPLGTKRMTTRTFQNGKFSFLVETPLQLFRRCTGRKAYNPQEYSEAGIYPGARSGKTDKLVANAAIYEACVKKWNLSVGERGMFPIVAYDKDQADIAFSYIQDKLERSPLLSQMVVKSLKRSIDLINGVTIAVRPCNFRQMRGYTILGAGLDEVAIWRDEESGANPAKEVIRAIRRGMATKSGTKLLKISSPFAKEGVVWDEYKDRAKFPYKLIWKQPSWEMNPAVDEEFLLNEFVNDPDFFWREFGAEFWESASRFLPPEKVDACVSKGRAERPHDKRFEYHSAIDAAFTSDHFAFGVGHKEGQRVIVDLARHWWPAQDAPVQKDIVLTEVAITSLGYSTAIVRGDQYAAEPIRQDLAERGVKYEEYTFTQNSKQAMYSCLRTLVLSGLFEIPDDPELVSQLKKLDARVLPGGNVQIKGIKGSKDDLATVAGLIALFCSMAQSGPQEWVKAYQSMKQSRNLPGAEGAGRTMCVDCGQMIPFGKEHHSFGGNLGRCMDCVRKGPPTYAAVKTPEGEAVPVGT